MTNTSSVRAAVIGATGYTGQELVALLRRHPEMALVYATSEGEAGRPVAGTALSYVPADEVPLSEVDIVFTCLPTGASGAWALRAREAGARAIDLSADLREGQGGAVYGLPELWRDRVAGQPLVANPGCYPTGILLALAPLIREGLLDASRPVMVNAASGVTGAGRSAKRELLFGDVAEDFRAYGVGNTHRHVPEIAQGLARANGGHGAPFVFTPHLLPVRRGILETMYVPVGADVKRAQVIDALRAAYEAERFVEVWSDGLPALRDVVARNVVALGVADVERIEPPMVLVLAAFDNLVKGAAGQAVQNANIMFGFDEAEGLPA
ncbi:MAG TPA: N-acetyl-gamma-glutamyl-phosphate reductase [Longimicrobiales bacterium]|nr:N-acetyl-gamma-glutamyl-phosphate reductase [Longimicrobiales bacterium]